MPGTADAVDMGNYKSIFFWNFTIHQGLRGTPKFVFLQDSQVIYNMKTIDVCVKLSSDHSQFVVTERLNEVSILK